MEPWMYGVLFIVGLVVICRIFVALFEVADEVIDHLPRGGGHSKQEQDKEKS